MKSILSIKTSWIFTGSKIHWWLQCCNSLDPESSRVALTELQPAPQAAWAQLTFAHRNTQWLICILFPRWGQSWQPSWSLVFPGGCFSQEPLHTSVHWAGLLFPALHLRSTQGSSSFAKAQAQPMAQPKLWCCQVAGACGVWPYIAWAILQVLGTMKLQFLS